MYCVPTGSPAPIVIFFVPVYVVAVPPLRLYVPDVALLRPISGSASMAVATDIIKQNGVDSFIGILAAVIMGATETTLYTIAVYTSSVGIKKTRFVLWAALIADFVGIVTSVAVCRFLS